MSSRDRNSWLLVAAGLLAAAMALAVGVLR